MENGRCRMHGGATPAGIASPNYKHGRYSKYLSLNLAKKLEEAVSDAELLSIREDIALVDSHNQELLEKIRREEPSARWPLVLTKFKAVKAASPGGSKKYTTALLELEAVIDAGYNDFIAWQEIIVNLEARRKLVESEEKRLVAMQQMLSIPILMNITSRMTETINKYVPDQNAREGIAKDFSLILSDAAYRGY